MLKIWRRNKAKTESRNWAQKKKCDHTATKPRCDENEKDKKK